MRAVALTVTLVAAASTAALAQTVPPPPPVAGAGPSPASRVEWSPAQPRQGSVVWITVRPHLEALGDSVRTESVGADSVAADAAAATATRPDSIPLDTLRAILDTLALRPSADSIGAVVDEPTVRASLFGEPLHFRREPSGEYVALGGLPVDAPTAVPLVIVIDHPAGRADTVRARMPIRRTAYRMEQLTVAPRFGQAPDSALAARIAREQALAAEVSRKSHATPRLWDGEFQRPRTARVTSAFGDGRQFNGRVQSRHMGLDLAGAVGAPVLATNRGVVALVGDFYYAGNAVYIDHGAGLVTAYFHLSAVDVAQGDTVTPGMRIGRVGATGRVTGPHLHWVARYGSVTVDPSTLLEIAPADSQPKVPSAARRNSSGAAETSRAAAPPAGPPPPRSWNSREDQAAGG